MLVVWWHNIIKKPRMCSCCCSRKAEDELYVVFECTAHNSIRNRPKLAGHFNNGHLKEMRTLFDDPQHKDLLGDLVSAFSLKRKQLAAFSSLNPLLFWPIWLCSLLYMVFSTLLSILIWAGFVHLVL